MPPLNWKGCDSGAKCVFALWEHQVSGKRRHDVLSGFCAHLETSWENCVLEVNSPDHTLNLKPVGFHRLCVLEHISSGCDTLTHTSCMELPAHPAALLHSVSYHWSFSHLHHTCHITAPRAAWWAAGPDSPVRDRLTPASELCTINSLPSLLSLFYWCSSLHSCIWSFITIVDSREEVNNALLCNKTSCWN